VAVPEKANGGSQKLQRRIGVAEAQHVVEQLGAMERAVGYRAMFQASHERKLSDPRPLVFSQLTTGPKHGLARVWVEVGDIELLDRSAVMVPQDDQRSKLS
jgi:hypothetical protein